PGQAQSAPGHFLQRGIIEGRRGFLPPSIQKPVFPGFEGKFSEYFYRKGCMKAGKPDKSGWMESSS
ncbi:hypothetical protein, partial [Akkermansia sp.]